MNIKGYRVGIVVLTTAATLLLLIGSSYLAQMATVQRPLARVLASRPEISEFNISSQNGVTLITMQLEDVANLHSTYWSIYHEAKQVMGGRDLVVKVSDRRSGDLEAIYHQLHFYIHEALSTGNFSRMAQAVAELAGNAGISYRVAVDDQHVFVQLHAGDSYLYEVVPRVHRGGQ
ncbi:MAG: hypothetical protein AB1445_00790 [Bacillota bacterium]